MAGAFKSVDSGESWGALTIELTDKSVRFIGIDPQMPSTLYAGVAHRGVFKSTDGGGDQWRNWSSGLPGRSVQAIVIDPKTPTTLYAGTLENGVYKSPNGGGVLVPG